MTGPEHFQMAEDLLKAAHQAADPENDNSDEEAAYLVGLALQRAQIHATLFAAAATLAAEAVKTGQLSLAEYGEWLEAAGVTQAA